MSHDLVRKSLEEETQDEFDERVERQAEFLRKEIREGNLNNTNSTIGLEIEVYSVDGKRRLAQLPDDVFGISEHINKELGLHNAEINTSPTLFDAAGLESQEKQVRGAFEDAREFLRDDDLYFVFDSLWTIPPEEGSVEYLSEVSVVDEGEEGEEDLTFAENMRHHPRYEAIDNYYLDLVDEVEIDVPGVRKSFPSILPESLATSIQPHLQVPKVENLPDYYNAGLRTMAPLLALSSNSPFLPPDLYEEEALENPLETVEETYHELRIPVFEQSVNAADDYSDKKVRFPKDIDSTEDVIRKIANDTTYSPFLSEWTEDDKEDRSDTKVGSEEDEVLELEEDPEVEDEGSYTDEFWEFDFKRGTYWRWLRAVIGGENVNEENDERSIRVEYRPLPTQPSINDIVGLQALASGLMVGLVEENHPISRLDWRKSKEDFYGVVENGIDAEIRWVTRHGDETTDKEVIFDELFEFASRGMKEQGVSEEKIAKYVEPLRKRWEERLTPSVWKKREVRNRLEEGDSFEDAVHGMQREYIEMGESNRSFADWF
ncbi:MAG: hypothetical protein SV760_10460 [Halobacteria archaeon]|nr:hypothetical protein [Halobacteria archaeon]